MKFLFAIAALLVLVSSVFAVDERALDECRFFHTFELDESKTGYANSGCVLNCEPEYSALVTHMAEENAPCPFFPQGRCHKGHCMTRPVTSHQSLDQSRTKMALTGRSKLGRIDVSMFSADLANFANTYMFVCIQNSTKPVTLPIKNRSQCAVSCKTSRLISSKRPFWNDFCANTSKFFVENSRVSFEIYNSRGAFMGGATITIPEVFKNKQNNKPFSLALSGGSNAGSMLVRVKYDRLN